MSTLIAMIYGGASGTGIGLVIAGVSACAALLIGFEPLTLGQAGGMVLLFGAAGAIAGGFLVARYE